MLNRLILTYNTSYNRFYTYIKKLIDNSNVPTLQNSYLKEEYVKGYGLGGSKIVKTSCCVLKPSGRYFLVTSINFRQQTCTSSYRFYSSIKKHIDYSNVPTINENDLDEQFVRGSGPGGQKINKTSSCVFLKHIPTGLAVKCQETRSLEQNRKQARVLLTTKLDNFFNGKNSVEAQTKYLLERKKIAYEQKKEKMKALKEAWKQKQNI